jgi:hypothetical protein
METKPAVGTVATREDIDNLGKKFGDKSIVAYFSADNAVCTASYFSLAHVSGLAPRPGPACSLGCRW